MTFIAKQNKSNHSRGFTLVEFLIYFFILGIVLTLIIEISTNVFIGKEKIEAHQEVGQNGRDVINEIIEGVSAGVSIAGTSNGGEEEEE
jgi:competence protein ComGC